MRKYLKDLFIVPCFEDSKIAVSFTPPQGCSMVRWEVLDKDRVAAKGTCNAADGKEVRFDALIKDFMPWNIDTPHLYNLRLLLSVGNETLQEVEAFGMRKIHATADQIYVNNQKFYVRGYIRGREAHDHPNMQNLDLEEFYAKNIRNAKRYGFNFIRFHSRIPPEECLVAADKLGMFIHIEIRKYFGKYQKERTMMNDAGELISGQEWIDAILQLRNHPSLMVYCMGNEIRHPGVNPQVAEISRLTKQYDPTRLFIDTCAHGEFDRDNVDIDVQHMSYFYPFGKDYDMFDNTYNWYIYGSAKGATLVKGGQSNGCKYEITTVIKPRRPVLAHEVCHYAALRDLDALEKKFALYNAPKPWWLDEVKKLVRLKGLEQDYPRMFEASRYFQFLGWKLGIEAARRSPLLCGFHFLQLADTERYENSNGILDCFDDTKGVNEEEFLKFNGDSVILVDLPRRSYFEGEHVRIPVMISHFSARICGNADMVFTLQGENGSPVFVQDTFEKVDLNLRGRREICRLDVDLPAVEKSQRLVLNIRLVACDDSYVLENSWNIWLYPNRPAEIAPPACTVALDEVNLSLRYPHIKPQGTLQKPEKLMIVNRFSKDVIRHLENGGDVLCLYRVPETRDRKKRAVKEQYYLPASWDRFKGVVWDRGTNFGGFIRPGKALDYFAHNDFIDMQFYSLIDDCDKIVLDDFPCAITPIIQGVDKASRDRFDVYTYKLSELQPAWTMRKFSYMFELKVGRGRLFVTGFNFTGLNSSKPETCAMFESIIRYVTGDAFAPQAKLSAEQFENYLLQKGKEPRIKERKMTQYWQLNEEPLESDKYWRESEEYIAEP